jgi:hypothetical protein
VKQFFTSHRLSSRFPYFNLQDPEALLRLVLYEDVYLHNGSLKVQTKGIAMDNCAAPPLAIIYMHYIEEHIKETCPGIILW